MKKILFIVLIINIIAHFVMVLISCGNSIDNVKRFVDYDTISGLMAYDVVIERSDSGVLVAKLIAPVMRNVETEDSTFL